MFISSFITLLDLVVKELGMVNAETPMLSSNPHYFVNHVEAIAWHLSLVILLAYDVDWVVVLGCFQIN